MALPPALLTSVQRMTVEVLCWGGGGVSHPLQITTRLVVNSFIITNSTLAGEHMLLIPW